MQQFTQHFGRCSIAYTTCPRRLPFISNLWIFSSCGASPRCNKIREHQFPSIWGEANSYCVLFSKTVHTAIVLPLHHTRFWVIKWNACTGTASLIQKHLTRSVLRKPSKITVDEECRETSTELQKNTRTSLFRMMWRETWTYQPIQGAPRAVGWNHQCASPRRRDQPAWMVEVSATTWL